MTTASCCLCLRWFVFILNFLFWLAGMGVLGVALWLLFDADFARVIGAKSGLNDFYIGVYILIAVGVVMTVLGFIGCCGALRKSQILLTAFFILLLLIFIAELTCGILMYYYQENVKNYVRDSMRDAIKTHYGENDAYTKAVDDLQTYFQCCGAQSYRSWAVSKHFLGANYDGEPPVEPWANRVFAVPRSCCTAQGLKSYKEDCGTGASLPPMEHLVESGMVHPKLLGMVLTMMLCCWYNYDEREGKTGRAYD